MLYEETRTKTKFTDWINDRIVKYMFERNTDYISFSLKNEKPSGGRPVKEYYLTIDTSKEICMIENNETGRRIRKYFIEVEKRYKEIIDNPANIFDFMRLALDQIEKNEHEISEVRKIALINREDIKEIKSKIDVKIRKDYCLASDIAEQLNLYSENKIPHSNLIGAIARQFNKNKEEIYYEIQYVRNTKKGKKGEIKERGYKIEEICYKII